MSGLQWIPVALPHAEITAWGTLPLPGGQDGGYVLTHSAHPQLAAAPWRVTFQSPTSGGIVDLGEHATRAQALAACHRHLRGLQQ